MHLLQELYEAGGAGAALGLAVLGLGGVVIVLGDCTIKLLSARSAVIELPGGCHHRPQIYQRFSPGDLGLIVDGGQRPLAAIGSLRRIHCASSTSGCWNFWI